MLHDSKVVATIALGCLRFGSGCCRRYGEFVAENVPPGQQSSQGASRPSHSLSESLDFLRTVLPLKRLAVSISRPSTVTTRSLFSIDGAAIDTGESIATNIADDETTSSPTDYPLVPLLTAPVQGQRDSGIAVVKALLLAGYALGRQETRLAVELGRGKRAHWPHVRPQRFPEQDSLELPIAIDLVAEYVEGKLKGGSGLPGTAREWLISLRTWCELLGVSLATPSPNRPPRFEPPSPLTPGPPNADDDDLPSFEELDDLDDLTEPPDEPDVSDDEPDPEDPDEATEPRRRAKPRRPWQRETLRQARRVDYALGSGLRSKTNACLGATSLSARTTLASWSPN